ncbi:MAG: aldehyde-activating protein [Parcubacteria group bacterium]|nr:aldehyde-activating protein [Parcubacteria group bacterium]
MEKRTGGCHCKKVRYEVEIDLSQTAIECNCTYCEIHGLILSFVPETQFTLLSGEDNLTKYNFNTEKIDHLFCKTCGVESFAKATGKDGVPGIAINVRSLDDIDLSTITRMPFDGRKL